MHIDLFWTGFAVGAVGLFLMIRLIDRLVHPILKEGLKGIKRNQHER
jgi:hypothetical protein